MKYGYIGAGKQLREHENALLEYSKKCSFNYDEIIIDKSFPLNRRFVQLLTRLKSEDEIIVKELSSLGRNFIEIYHSIEHLVDKNIKITVLGLNSLSKLDYHLRNEILLEIVKQLRDDERDLLSFKIKNGQRLSKKGLGRRGIILPPDFEEYYRMYKSKEKSAEEIASVYHVSRATFYRHIKFYEKTTVLQRDLDGKMIPINIHRSG